MVNVNDECLIFYIFRLRTMTESTRKILKLHWKTPGFFPKRVGTTLINLWPIFKALLLLLLLVTGAQLVMGRSSTPADSDAVINDDMTHMSSSSSSSSMSSSSHSVVTPSLVSAVSSLLSNLLALAPHDVSSAIRQHGILHALMQ